MEFNSNKMEESETILYHYTDQNGFVGIFSNKELWATQINYLNDSTEFILGLDIAKKQLDINPLNKSPMSQDIELIKELKETITDIRYSNICVCSFSEKRDALSQWRGYSNTLCGYSIGFKKSVIDSHITSEKIKLKKCLYNKDDYENKIKKLIEKTISEYQNHPKPVDISPITSRFGDDLSIISATIKHYGFKEESEWRLISTNEFKDFDIRPSKSMLIPFFKISIDKILPEAVNDIIVGHTPNIEIAIKSTELFLIKCFPPESQNDSRYLPEEGEYDFSSPIIVNESSVPFRNW